MRAEYPLAAESTRGGEEGEGEGDGTESEMTFMASFIPLEQCSETPQAYHFLPGLARVIMSLPVGEAPDILHSWKSAALLSLCRL